MSPETTKTVMSRKAAFYIAANVALGVAILAAGLWTWTSPDLPRYFSFLLLTLFASTLKVRLPRTTTTMSVGFLFVLVAIAEYSFFEAVFLASCMALLQSFWKAKQRPMPVQVLFNVSALATSSGVAYALSHYLLSLTNRQSYLLLLSLAAACFFVVDTCLVAGVISLTEQIAFRLVWKQCCLWAFPYYGAGVLVAGMICASCGASGWQVTLFFLPLILLVYLYYRVVAERANAEQLRQLS